MRKIGIAFFIFAFLSSSLFAFSEEQLKLTHNQEFALYQRLQLDTVIARKSKNNRIVLSELALRDLVPSMNDSNREFYTTFNKDLGALRLVDIQRERLEFLHEENQKSLLTALVPNALSIATMAITTGLKNPLGAIIGVVGTAVSSVSSYIDAKNQANLEYMQSAWELEDEENKTLLMLGNESYEHKCRIAKDLHISNELTLSTKDLEAFVDFCNEPNANTRFIKLSNLNKRLEILPDYWMELALTTYKLENYEATLSYIDKFEKIYCPIIYHDSDYAHLLMVKSDCINRLSSETKYQDLEKIGDLLVEHIEAKDWQGKFYTLSLYMEIYRATNDVEILKKAYSLFPFVLTSIGAEYSSALSSYLNREFVKKGLKEIDTDIESAKRSVETATKAFARAREDKYDKKGSAYQNIEQKLKKAEKELEKLEEYRKGFERTGKLMIPPSPDFLCKMMERYLSISQKLGETASPAYKALCQDFSEKIPQSARIFAQYQNTFSAKEQVPAMDDIIPRCEKTGGFIGIGRTHSIILEIPLSRLNVSSEGSEKLINSDDIQLTLSIDRLKSFNFSLEELSIETGDTLSESYMSIRVNNMDKYELNMEKPDKDSVHALKFTVSSSKSYFDPINVDIKPESDVYNEIVNSIKYQSDSDRFPVAEVYNGIVNRIKNIK
jgi:DNA replication protein DnaD